MKLCFLANANSIHSFKWIKYFADKGYEIHWVSLTPNQVGEIKGVKFYRLKEFGPKSFDILFNVIPARKLIKKINPDILHAHYAGVNGVLGALSGFHPYILTAWGSDILIAPKSRVVRSLIRFALSKADLITCDAEHMKKAMVKLGVDPSKIEIIHFGIDIKKFAPGPEDQDVVRRLGTKDAPVVISLRSLDPLHDIETLVRAVPLVLKKVPKAIFVIAGKGHEEENLKNLADNLGVSQSIRFIGWVSQDEIPYYLRAADVFVSTALSDAGVFGGSIAEAMACGLPVVVTNIGENENWIQDGGAGYLFPIKSPDILAKRITDLLKNQQIRKKFGERGRVIVEKEGNYYREMEKMQRLYDEVIIKKKY